jgi:hypothetical protein
MDIATKVCALGAVAALAGSAFANPVVVVADSVAGFSGSQGMNGWSYGWYNLEDISRGDGSVSANTADFRAFDSFSSTTGWWSTDSDSAGGNHGSGAVPGSFAVVTHSLMHAHAMLPNSSMNLVAEEQWAVRRWTSDFSGEMTLSGFIAHNGVAIGNGTEAHLFVDGVSVYSYDVAAGNTTGIEFSLDLLVAEGSHIEMVLGAKGDPLFDATEFTVQMSRVIPAPGSLALIGLSGLAAGRRRRR